MAGPLFPLLAALAGKGGDTGKGRGRRERLPGAGFSSRRQPHPRSFHLEPHGRRFRPGRLRRERHGEAGAAAFPVRPGAGVYRPGPFLPRSLERLLPDFLADGARAESGDRRGRTGRDHLSQPSRQRHFRRPAPGNSLRETMGNRRQWKTDHLGTNSCRQGRWAQSGGMVADADPAQSFPRRPAARPRPRTGEKGRRSHPRRT